MLSQKPTQSESGQVIILAVIMMTIVFAIGAITVDLTLWLSERRGSQTDADLAALAGAFELLDPNASANDAIVAAEDNLTANDEQLNANLANPVLVDDSCFNRGVNDAVTVDVRHDSRALFMDIFGLADSDIGAHAKACVGAAQAPGNLVPFQIDDNPGPCFDDAEEPIFTAMCPIELGAQGGGSGRGMLDLVADADYCSDGGGGADIEELIEWGATGICLIDESPSSGCGSGPWYECVAIQNGNPQDVLDGTAARVARDGDCDTDGNGVDDFDETVSVVFDTGDPLTSIYEARDCDPVTDGKQISPRLVTIVILEEEPDNGGSGVGYPIVAFAGFYLAGCAHENDPVDDESDLDPGCDSPGQNRHLTPSEDLYVMAPVLGLLADHRCGHQQAPTCTPTPTPSPTPTPTPTPSPTPTAGPPTDSPTPSPSETPAPEDCGSPGHCVVYGRFVNLIVSNGDITAPTDQTTLFGIALVE